MPTRAPVRPPTAPPTAAPESAAMIGPAAMSGPRPGMARAPMPASQPSAPPTTGPVPAPVAAPSGALVWLEMAKLLVPGLSGMSTEISPLVNPAAFKRSTIWTACIDVFTVQKTAWAITDSLQEKNGLRLDFQLTRHVVGTRHVTSNLFDLPFLICGFDRPPQGHFAALRDDFHVMGVRRHLRSHDLLADLGGDVDVGPVLVLVDGCLSAGVAIPRVYAGVIRF